MKALTTSIVAFVVIMAGAMLRGRLREMLPKHHLSEETKDIVKVGIAMLTTLAALVLGLLIASALLDLAPATDAQKRVRDRALQLAGELAQMRWLVLEQAGSSIQMPFLVILVSWLAIIAGALGIFAPRNATVLAVTVLCSLAVSCAIFLILEMDRPFSGLLRISDAPLREAISFLER